MAGRGSTLRRALLGTALLIGLGLVGCSDDQPEAGPPGTPMTDVTIECDRFADTAQRIADAQNAIYDGQDTPADDTAVDALVTELDALKEDAPAEVGTALTDLGEGFRSAQRLLDDPTKANREELVELAPKLSEDSQAVTAWIVSQCR